MAKTAPKLPSEASSLPGIEAVILTHNDPVRLNACLWSIFNQSLRPDSILLVNTGAWMSEAVGGTLDIYRLYLPPERRTGGFGFDLLARHAIMCLVGLKFRRLKSSMLQSLERGRRTEIDYLNGYVVEQGRENGVPVPVNAALTALVREIEAGARPIRPDNLKELLH